MVSDVYVFVHVDASVFFITYFSEILQKNDRSSIRHLTSILPVRKES